MVTTQFLRKFKPEHWSLSSVYLLLGFPVFSTVPSFTLSVCFSKCLSKAVPSLKPHHPPHPPPLSRIPHSTFAPSCSSVSSISGIEPIQVQVPPSQDFSLPGKGGDQFSSVQMVEMITDGGWDFEEPEPARKGQRASVKMSQCSLKPEK